MSKAQDVFKEIVEEVKKQGLDDMAEEAVKAVIRSCFKVGGKYASQIKNPIVLGLVVSLMPSAEKSLLELADKIDGEEG